MGLVLPGALTWVLDMVGIDWPNIDEDDLRSMGDTFREISQELNGNTDEAKSDIEQMLSENSSQSMELFQALWQKLSDGHMQQFAEGLTVLADALDISAVVVVGLKVAAIAQLAILAAEIISDQAEAVVTFGASEALIPVQTMATREIMKTIVDKAVKEAEQQVLAAVEAPVIDALTSAAEELGTQLLGDALGVSSGVDMSKVASAGESGFSSGVQNLASDPLGAMGLSNGSDSEGSSDPEDSDGSDGSDESEDTEDPGGEDDGGYSTMAGSLSGSDEKSTV